MTDDWRDHYKSLDDKSYASIACVARALDATGVPATVIGGWALYAYGSPVPSIDTDLVLDRRRYAKRLTDYTNRHCQITIDDPLHRYVETLDEREPMRITPTTIRDADALAFRFPDVLDGHIETRPIHVMDERLRIPVPAPDPLGFLKLCALAGRQVAWEATQRPATMAQITTAWKDEIRSRDEAHWRRKGGKDVFDLAYLLHGNHTTVDRILRIAKARGLDGLLRARLAAIPDRLMDWAASLAAHARVDLDFSVLRAD